MGKIFNIAGPCIARRHYMLPALARLPEVKRLIEDKSYFVLHAHEIHDRRYNERITLDDMHEAKEKIIRERCANLNSIWKRKDCIWMQSACENVGKRFADCSVIDKDAVKLACAHGAVNVCADGKIVYTCPIVEQLLRQCMIGGLQNVA